MHLLNEGTDDGQPAHDSARTDSPEQYENLPERDTHDDLAIPGDIELDGQDISQTGAEQDTNQGRNPDAQRLDYGSAEQPQGSRTCQYL